MQDLNKNYMSSILLFRIFHKTRINDQDHHLIIISALLCISRSLILIRGINSTEPYHHIVLSGGTKLILTVILHLQAIKNVDLCAS